jgi:DNA primase
VPKYLNTPRTDLYDKSSVLFGLWRGRAALAQGAHPVIAEGPFDAIAITTASRGRYVGLAPCGTALTTSQLGLLDGLVGLRGVGVLVAFDSDEAGRRAAVKAFHLLSPLTDKAEAITFPAGQDPAQILNDGGRAALAEMLASCTRPLADPAIEAEVARWDRWLVYAEGQMKALRAAAPVIAALPSAQVGRQVVRLAERLRLDHATVTEAVTDALTELVATGRAHLSCDVGRTDGRSRDQVSVAGQDYPCYLRQVTAAASAAPPPARKGRTSAERARLSVRRVPR